MLHVTCYTPMTFVVPNKILNQLGLRENMTAADFGCGSGGWVIPLAVLLEKGRVFAVDLQEDVLSSLAGRVKQEGIFNIKTILANMENGVPEIKSFSCGLVLMTNLLFQVDEKVVVFKEANRVLDKGGKLLVVDWKLDSVLGPKEGKVSADEVKRIAQETGFRLEKEINAGDYHYALVFTKA